MSITFLKYWRQTSDTGRQNWNNQDIADFYRAVDILKQAGLNTEVDSGLTDEGDPWFVFLRPDNGEVIAHFAQIDGAFIAVSAINQEVYKGKNIRSIVDQMLDRHPMLLPQSKSGGRLFLHPTAALSAFLAAAFILTIDGVKANNLQDVMASISAEKNLTNTSNTIPTFENSLRSDPLKLMFSDLSSSNYNHAILGAALIVHELSQNEFDIASQLEVDENDQSVNGERVSVVDNEDKKIVISSEKIRKFDDQNYAAYSFKSVSLQINEKEIDDGDPKQNFVPGDIENKTPDDELSAQEASDSVPVLDQDFSNFLNSGLSAFENNYQAVTFEVETDPEEEFGAAGQLETTGQLEAVDQPRIEDQSQTARQLDFENESVVFDPILETLVENVQGAFDKIPFAFSSHNIANDASLGMTFDFTGELKPVSFKSFNIDDQIVLPKTALVDVYENSKSDKEFENLEHSVSNEHADLTTKKAVTMASEPLANPKPILGHVLVDIDDTLNLSNAIDVVFYDGGDAEITGFELGTDLLWFFLSTEELATAKNSVTQSGDLVLDFGDIGTLTFLSVISDTTMDYVGHG